MTQRQPRTVSSYVFDRASLDLTRTKLYRPVTGGDFVGRARLLDRLNRGRHLPLTLVSAPAGSGKTTLLGDWLSICPCPSAWLSLDEGDSHLSIFLSYLLTAIRTVVPEACEQTMSLLQASECLLCTCWLAGWSTSLKSARPYGVGERGELRPGSG